jgi:hypothetical protein
MFLLMKVPLRKSPYVTQDLSHSGKCKVESNMGTIGRENWGTAQDNNKEDITLHKIKMYRLLEHGESLVGDFLVISKRSIKIEINSEISVQKALSARCIVITVDDRLQRPFS